MDTKKIIQLVQTSIESALSQFYTAIPVRVKSYNEDTQKAQVEPLVSYKRRYTKEEQIFPPIPEVPVGFTNSDDGDAYMSFPVKKGDIGLVIFSSLDIDAYLAGDASVIAESSTFSRNSLKDAMFIPIIRPFKKGLKNVSTENVKIHNKTADFEILPAGKFRLQGKSNVEALNEIKDYMEKLIEIVDKISNMLMTIATSTVPTALGPQTLQPAAVQIPIDNINLQLDKVAAEVIASLFSEVVDDS